MKVKNHTVYPAANAHEFSHRHPTRFESFFCSKRVAMRGDFRPFLSRRFSTWIVGTLLVCVLFALQARAQLTINGDIQAGGGGAYSGVNAVGKPGYWNHLGSDQTTGLLDASGNPTSVNLRLFGANGRWDSEWTNHDLQEDYLYRDSDAWANAEFSGLAPSRPFDVYIYTGVEGGRYRIGGLERSARNFTASPTSDPFAGGVGFLNGSNYVSFIRVQSDPNGHLLIQYQNSPRTDHPHGNFAGFTLISGLLIGDIVTTQSVPNAVAEVRIGGLPGDDIDNAITLHNLEGSPPRATGGWFRLRGFSGQVSRAEVDTSRQVLKVTGQLRMPGPHYADANRQPIWAPVGLEFDRFGNVSVNGGAVLFPSVRLSVNLELRNFKLRFPASSSRDAVATFDVKLAAGETEACPDLTSPSPTGLSSEFRFHQAGQGGEFRLENLKGNNLRMPIGGNARLEAIDDYIDGLFSTKAQSDYNIGRFRFNRMAISAGCPLTVAGVSNVYPVYAEGTGTHLGGLRQFEVQKHPYFGSASFFNIPAYNFKLGVTPYDSKFEGDVTFGGNQYSTRVWMTLRPGEVTGTARGTLTIPADHPAFGGQTFPNVAASIDQKGLRGSYSHLLSEGEPEKCSQSSPISLSTGLVGTSSINLQVPEFCSPPSPDIKVTFGFEQNWESNRFSIVQRNHAPRDPWDPGFRPRVQDQETGGNFTFLTNWDRLDRASTGRAGQRFAAGAEGTPICKFNVPANHPGVFFRLAYSNLDAPKAGLTVTFPNGTQVNSDQGPLPFGFDNALGYSRFNPDAREVVVLLINPSPGEYEVTVENADLLEDYSVEAVAQNRLPFAELLQVEGPNEEGIIEVLWAAEDITRPTTITAFLEPENQGNSGFFLASKTIEQDTPEEEAESFVINLDLVDAPAGAYYIMLKTDDGKNAPDFSYSDFQFEFADPDAPEPVPAIASAPGFKSIRLAWEPSDSPSVGFYKIVYGPDSDSDASEQVISVLGTESEAVIPDLINGVPYLVHIVTVNSDGIQSLPSETHRVIPTAGPGLDRPVITSTPDLDATAGKLYTYFAIAMDPDSQRPLTTLPVGFDPAEVDPGSQEPILTWSLVEAPEGMEVHPTGLITWTPTGVQLGSNKVTLRSSKRPLFGVDGHRSRSLVSDQTFSIEVLAPENLNGLEPHPYTFISTPPLFTTDTETYRYRPQFLAPDGDSELMLVSGPEGMEVTDDNEVVWDVPENAEGDYVWIRAFTSNGDSFDQLYFLHVYLDWNQLPIPTRIADIRRRSNGEVLLSWVGSAESYAIQRKDKLDESDWKQIAGPLEHRDINAFIDREGGSESGYYRIVEWGASFEQ